MFAVRFSWLHAQQMFICVLLSRVLSEVMWVSTPIRSFGIEFRWHLRPSAKVWQRQLLLPSVFQTRFGDPTVRVIVSGIYHERHGCDARAQCLDVLMFIHHGQCLCACVKVVCMNQRRVDNPRGTVVLATDRQAVEQSPKSPRITRMNLIEWTDSIELTRLMDGCCYVCHTQLGSLHLHHASALPWFDA